ncbi:MAG TPA: tRNA (adenosine(37)-N6)-threonylcarbamoyltransferase complex dimerization subunit type 1 TsaB [Bacteroidales bacterium]|jgi:tRNA threonylcarbamoyladenosine biosynthesis protein TsaB|nr:tRNA (adenosine(37)-N6)-threonylcarbamoyltransferase complex dimerization subunit type 1 TsaB [Bacteroidales bacterium]
MILCLETSTPLCSVALCDNSGVVALRESNDGKSHASLLTVFIDELLTEAGIGAADLEAVAVSRGPGSYTGLRIGVSAAKGIAYAASVPMIGVDTTLSMFHGVSEIAEKKSLTGNSTLFVPMLDARRMEVYYSIYTGNGETYREVSAEVIDENSFSDIPADSRLVFFGDGASKCRVILEGPDKIFIENFRISAAHMYKPAFKAFRERRFEDTAYFEPFYLKDFIASRPKKNILGR